MDKFFRHFNSIIPAESRWSYFNGVVDLILEMSLILLLKVSLVLFLK